MPEFWLDPRLTAAALSDLLGRQLGRTVTITLTPAPGTPGAAKEGGAGA